MSFVAAEQGNPEAESGVAVRPKPKHRLWPLIAVLGGNSLSLPATLVAASLSNSPQYYEIADGYLIPAMVAVLLSQLFLLAFWMAFGSWPSRWRSLLIFAVTSGAGLVFGVALALIEYVQGWDDGFRVAVEDLIQMAVVIPLFASILVWVTNAMFIIPSWYLDSEIRRQQLATNAKPRSKTFGMKDVLIWTGQIAIPLGLLQVLALLTDSREDLAVLVSPYLFFMACATPLAVALLSPRISILAMVATCLWSLATGITFEVVAGDNVRETLPGWSFLFVCGTIAGNLFTLRRMGLCWQPRVDLSERADG